MRLNLAAGSFAQCATAACVMALPFGCGSAAKPTAGEVRPAFFIRPYLTNVGSTQVVLNWRLGDAAASILEYGTDRVYRRSVVTNEQLQHTVTLSDLEPGTRYFYRVNNRFTGQFTTRDERDEAFRFVAIGHTHGTEGFDHYPDHLLVDAIAGLNPDFVVHTGDITYFSRVVDYSQFFFDLFEPIASRIPIYIAPGNHDAGWPTVPNLTTFKQLFPFGYPSEIRNNSQDAFYSVDYGDMVLLFISYTSNLTPKSLQRKWLQQNLQAASDRLIVVVMGGAQESYDKTEVLNFFSSNGVDLVLQGDGQGANISYHRSMPVLFVGSGGSRPHYLVYCEKRNAYLIMKLMDVMGTVHATYWLYHRHEHSRRLDLLQLDYSIAEQEDEVVYSFPLMGMTPDDVNGLQFRPAVDGGQSLTVFANVVNAYGKSLRTQLQSFGERDTLVTLSVPMRELFAGSNGSLQRITLTFRKSGPDTGIRLQAAWLY